MFILGGLIHRLTDSTKLILVLYLINVLINIKNEFLLSTEVTY